MDGGLRASSAALEFLRRRGEVGPLHPLAKYLRPALRPNREAWLQALALARGLVFRPGGAWIFWQPALPPPQGGYALTARVVPRSELPARPDCSPDPEQPPLLVMGLAPDEIAALAGPPGTWLANASLALMISSNRRDQGDLLLGGDLGAEAWQYLLQDPGMDRLLAGVSCYAADPAQPETDFSRGLLMSCLPWLVLGALQTQGNWIARTCLGEHHNLATPPIASLTIDVDHCGIMYVSAHPANHHRLAWQGLARSLADPQLPPPLPLRRALLGG